MKSKNYAFKDIKNKNDKENFIELLRHQTTAEYGGYQIFDGRRSHSILFELFSDEGAGTLIRK